MQRRLDLLRQLVTQAFLILMPLALFGCSSSAPFQPSVSSVIPGAGVPISIGHDLYHEVAPLETLWRISKMYGVPMQEIAKANNLKSRKSIKVGQRLLIPRVVEIRPIIPVYHVRSWTHVVIHHSATHEGNAITIDQVHSRRGFENGLGYHFLIDNGTKGKEEGQIEVGPRWIRQMNGAHANANGMNENGIGICLIGNFSESYVSERQLNSLVFLVSALLHHYQIPLDRVIRHRDVPGKRTECPGNHFPWEEFKRRLAAA